MNGRMGLLALVAMPMLAGAAPSPMGPDATRLEIVAVGTVNRVPDVALIGAGVVTQAGSAGAAMAGNARQVATMLAALRKSGVADRDIQTASVSLTPQYRYADKQPPLLTGYQASNQVNIRFRDVARAGAILDTLVAAGANQVNGPSLMVDQPDVALDEARTQAVATARARAELYARAAGLHVARIVAISEAGRSDPVARPMMATMMARKAPDTSIEPGEQTLEVTLSITFELR